MLQADRENVQWLLSFLRLDLTNQTIGVLIDLAYRVHSLPLEGQAAGVGIWAPNVGLGKGKILEPPVAFLQALQAKTRDGIRALEEGKSWQLPRAPETWFLVPDPEAGGLRKRYTSTAIEAEAAFFAVVSDLLVAAWPELQRCPNPACRSLFLPSKPRQQYCSSTCSDKVRQAKYLPKRTRDYSREYLTRAAKRLGRPADKVRRQARAASLPISRPQDLPMSVTRHPTAPKTGKGNRPKTR